MKRRFEVSLVSRQNGQRRHRSPLLGVAERHGGCYGVLVNRFTRREQVALAVIALLLFTGLATKAWRPEATSPPEPATTIHAAN